MAYEFEREDSLLVVKVEGKLDAQTAPELGDAMSEALDGVSSVTFELSDLEYISSGGLRVLLATYKLMMKRDGEMSVVNADENVMSVLEMSGFAALFGVE